MQECFHRNKATVTLIHSRSSRGLFTSTPLAAHSLCLSAVMLLLPPTCSVEGPAHSYLTLPLPEKPTHPSPPLRHVHSMCASVCVCSCVCTCTCSTAYSFLCVFERLLVCVQRVGGVVWSTDIAHLRLFVYNMA